MINDEIRKVIRNDRGRLALPDAIEEAFAPPQDPALVPDRKVIGLPPSSASAIVKDPVSGMEFVMGTCMRKAWYDIKGVPRDPGIVDLQSIRRMAGGNLYAEYYVYDPAKKAGLYAAEEISFFDQKNLLSGRLDLMTFLPSSVLKSGIEVKCMSPFKCTPFVKSNSLGFKRLEPRYTDLPQTISYMQRWMKYGVRAWHLWYMTWDHASQHYALLWSNVPDEALEPADDAYLTCLSHDGEWDMPWLTWGQVRKRYQALLEALKKDTPPPRDYQRQYSNSYLLQLAKHAGTGSQFIPMGVTEAKSIEKKYEACFSETGSRNPEEHEQYIEKGDWNCGFCDWADVCWSGLGNPSTPAVPVEDFHKLKRPTPEVATPATPRAMSDKETF